jgi:hypothetical protein
MCRPGIDAMSRLIAAALGTAMLGGVLGGCSDLYLDRRDTIALSAGDAIAANRALQTVDPWPRQSGNPNFSFNGQRMQAAVERYREGKVTSAADAVPSNTSAQPPSVTQVSVGGSSTSSTGNSTATTPSSP